MKTILAENAGFCFGVKRAVNRTMELSDSGVKVVTLGELIHNTHFINELKEKGVGTIDDVDEAGEGVTVLIRSHGEAPSVYRRLEEKGIPYEDLTCPIVARIHDKVRDSIDEFDRIIVAGKKTHPEVIGTLGWAGDKGIVVQSPEELNSIPEEQNVLLVGQTTMSQKIYDSIADECRKKFSKCTVFDSICKNTLLRQKEAVEIAKKSDCILVIGDRNSSNTRELYNLVKNYCENVIFVEDAKDVHIENLTSYDIIGIIAGASAPASIIGEVHALMELNETQVNETAEVQETVSETETNFAEELEKTFKSIRRGQIVTGFVVHVNDDEIAVNIGYKADGLIKLENMGLEEGEKPADKFHEGDEIEAQIVDLNDGEGNVVLSRKKIESQLKWKEFVDNLDMDAIYECTVTKTIKGGVLTKFNGYDAFIPASQLTEKYVEDLSTFVGQNLLVKIIDVDKKKKRFVLSNKAALIEQKEEQKKMIFQSFEQGSVVRGVVKRLTDFGAFVDVGGVDGLLHVTDMSWSRVAHPKDILSNGQEIDVKILKVDPEKGRISLGYKQLLPKPWETVTERYAVGDVVKGKVVRIAPFGAFVELEPTIDGLVHISQVTNHRIEKVEDALQLGQEIEAKVLEVNPEKKRISLSIRALMNDRKAAEAAENPAEEEAAPKRPRKEERVIIPPKENATTSLADLFKAAEEAANFEEAVEESEEE